ncbi:hypothetical protein SNK04_003936 [Fusarium graminearum]
MKAAGPSVEVTVGVKVVIVPEVQKVEKTTKVVVSTMTASVVEQCFLGTYNPLAQGPGMAAAYTASTQSASPAASADAATDPDDSSHDSTPNYMTGGLDKPHIYEQDPE